MLSLMARPQAPFLVLTDTHTGNPVAVNTLQVESFEDDELGTEITFASGSTVVVREGFEEVATALGGTVPA